MCNLEHNVDDAIHSDNLTAHNSNLPIPRPARNLSFKVSLNFFMLREKKNKEFINHAKKSDSKRITHRMTIDLS